MTAAFGGWRRRNAAWLTFVMAVTCTGCDKRDTILPPVDPGPPDLRAYELGLFWGEGDIGSARGRKAGMGGVAIPGNHDRFVIVGTGVLPSLRMITNVVGGEDFQIHFFDDDSLWWDVNSTELRVPPSAIIDIHGKFWAPADTGLHVLRAVIDPTNRVAEVDETNNEATFVVEVIPGNLSGNVEFQAWIDGALRPTTSVWVGTPILIIAGSGARGHYPNHRAVLEVCGTTLLDHRVSLSGGTMWADTRADTVAYTPQVVGSCQVRFSLDPDGEFLMDSNRSDNVVVRTLSVSP
jgi:hypothetical protein